MEIRPTFLCLILTIYYLIDYGGAVSRNQHAKPVKSKRKIWTPQEEADLMFYDVLTKTGEPNHFARIKSMWLEEYPNSNITDSNLCRKIHNLRRESQEEGERKKNFKWNQELERELVEVYHNTSPYKRNAGITLREEWKRRHPDYQASEICLLKRAVKVSREHGILGYENRVLPETDFEWNEQKDSDLSHIRNVALEDGKSHWRTIHQTWSELYPQYNHVTPEQLKERVEHLKENTPNKYSPWTRGQNQELLDIYDRTMPDVEDQGQRIHDIWTEKHPRYKFMTPYYLQIHASTLAHEREIKAAGRKMFANWTHEDQAKLVDMYYRHRGNRREFHKEWVRKHPRRAYMIAATLARLAVRYAVKGGGFSARDVQEGSQSKAPEIKHRKYDKYTPQEKQEMINLYDRTDPQRKGHIWRIETEMNEKPRNYKAIQGASVKQLVTRWKRRASEKIFGKAPMLDPSDEAGPSSAARMSEDSE